jgi:ATP-dependent DNA helicase RecG
MIIHRDYRLPYDSVVKVFDNKIEFYNPGKLPEGITIGDLLSGDYKSTPRNRKITDFFKNMGWIEKYGSGISRIRAYFKEAQLPDPEFKLISEGFQVTVFGDVDFNIEKGTEKLTVNQQKIIDNIIDNPNITIAELVEIVGIAASKVKVNLAKLKAKGLLKREGSDKGGYWKTK